MFQNMTRMICVGLLVLLVAAAGPALAVTGNSHTWEGSFEGESFPTDGGLFSLLTGTENSPNVTVKPGPPTHVEFHPTATVFYTKEVPVDFDSGFSVEWRFRSEGGTANSGQVKLTAYDTGQGEHVVTRLQYPGGNNGTININCCSGPSFPLGMHNALLPNNPYHTFRMTVLGDDATLYVDGVSTPMAITSPAAGTDAGAPHALGGLEFGSKIMHPQFDYIRWTSTGAFAPVVPEPASLGLLGIGGLLLIRRRAR